MKGREPPPRGAGERAGRGRWTSVSRRPAWFLAAVAALVLLGVPACRGEERPGRADWRLMQLFGGGGSIEILQRAAKVEAFRISKDADVTRNAENAIGPIPAVSDPVPVSEETGRALARILLDPATYDFGRAKSEGGLDPTVGLRFSLDSSRVDVALCLRTRQLLIYRYGKLTGFEDFDPAETRMRELIAQALP